MNVRTSGVCVFYSCITNFQDLPLPPLTGSPPSPAIHHLQLLQVYLSASFPAWLFTSACLTVKIGNYSPNNTASPYPRRLRSRNIFWWLSYL